MSELLCGMCEKNEGDAVRHRPANRSTYGGLWTRMQHLLETCPPEELRIASIARRLNVSERHLRATFKDHFGVSLGEYLLSFRIRRGVGLLMTSDLALKEIADRCGYSSSANFHRAFRKHVGVTPTEFRKGR